MNDINGSIKILTEPLYGTSLKAIYVPAKKYDYYYERISYPFYSLIVEMEPVKKAKKKK